MDINQLRKRAIWIVILGVLLAVLFWVYGHSFIEITVSESIEGDISYRLLDQGSHRQNVIKNQNKKVKKLVRRGNHEIEITQGEKSYFKIVKAQGFLKTTKVAAGLLPEKSRTFVGNNPSPCTYLVNQVLLSSACGGVFYNANVHVPATNDSPTLVKKPKVASEGVLEGIVTTKEGNVLLMGASRLQEDQGAPHTAYLLGENITLTDGVGLDLQANKTYDIRAHKDGFVVADSDLTQVLYYESRHSTPQALDIEKPKDSKLLPFELSTYGESIGIAYSNNTAGEIADTDNPDDPNHAKVRTIISIATGNNKRSVELKGSYSYVRLCGESKLCAIKNEELQVFDIAKKPKQLYRVSDVHFVESIQGTLVLARKNGVLGINTESSEGAIDYSYGDYRYCGMQKTNDKYLLCLGNHKNKKVALLVDPAQPNPDSIDKKVSELLRVPGVVDVSIYTNHIFISPNTGNPIFDKELGAYRDNPETIANSSRRIQEYIDKLGIDRNAYTIINVAD